MGKLNKAELRKTEDGQFYIVIKSKNGEILNTSEMFTQKHNAEGNFAALVDAVLEGIVFFDTTSKRGPKKAEAAEKE